MKRSLSQNGRPAAVLVSPDEFEGWKETLLIRSDPAFLKEIKKGIKMLKQRVTLYPEELFEEYVGFR
jgi:antitoxin YefM